jgi:hypothetical protein
MDTLYNDLMTILYNGETACVTIRKLDGTLRDMRCRLGEDGVDAGTYARVYDLDADGYRTIRKDALLTVGI